MKILIISFLGLEDVSLWKICGLLGILIKHKLDVQWLQKKKLNNWVWKPKQPEIHYSLQAMIMLMSHFWMQGLCLGWCRRRKLEFGWKIWAHRGQVWHRLKTLELNGWLHRHHHVWLCRIWPCGADLVDQVAVNVRFLLKVARQKPKSTCFPQLKVTTVSLVNFQ